MIGESGRTRPVLYRCIALAAGIIFIAIDLLAITLRRMRNPGDFDISMEFGRRFLTGQQLYQGGLHFPYLPTAAMFFSIFSVMPRPLAFLLFYAIAIAGLWLVMRMLTAMVCGARPSLRDAAGPIAVVTLILASHYIIRDLDDGGPNLVLLALAMGGIYGAWSGHDITAAGFLGAATALKATMGIFIPFLIWKRRWRLAVYTTMATALWLALPILHMGPANWWTHQRQWIRSAMGFAAGLNAAAARYYGESNSGNQALGPAVRHLMETRLAFIPVSASAVSAIMGLALVGIFCWLTVSPYGERLGAQWLRESSGLLILAVLLAPIAWLQHLVIAIPAIYLIVADWFADEEFNLPSKAAMLFYIVFALLLNRGLIGKARYTALLEYHVQTLCMLLIFGVLMLRQRGKISSARRCATDSWRVG
ncbi:MAG TPA: glycosyltransferase family 87 protein [Candidatus Binataceae bacterium]|jgi:hypothetical protein|nr:glycosyltransferase family 87 protein [Candidatus Binataceae bacterium]